MRSTNFSRTLTPGVAALERVREKLKLYCAAVLKAVVEGALTAECRQQHPYTEPASALLLRILVERRRNWQEEQLRKFKEKGKEPPKDWKVKYKEPVTPDTTTLPPLPEGWCWASLDQVFRVDEDGSRCVLEMIPATMAALNPLSRLLSFHEVHWHRRSVDAIAPACPVAPR